MAPSTLGRASTRGGPACLPFSTSSPSQKPKETPPSWQRGQIQGPPGPILSPGEEIHHCEHPWCARHYGGCLTRSYEGLADTQGQVSAGSRDAPGCAGGGEGKAGNQEESQSRPQWEPDRQEGFRIASVAFLNWGAFLIKNWCKGLMLSTLSSAR